MYDYNIETQMIKVDGKEWEVMNDLKFHIEKVKEHEM